MAEAESEKSSMSSSIITGNTSAQAWSLPVMADNERVIKAIKEKPRRGERSVSGSGHKPGEGEIVEDYDGATQGVAITAEQLKEITDEAHKEGYGDGYKEGLEKGTADGVKKGTVQGKDQAYNETKKKLDDEAQRLSSIASVLADPMTDQNNKIENVVLDMVLNLTRELLQSEIQQSPDKLYHVIKRVINELPVGSKNISVLLNKQDADLIEQYIPENQRDWSVAIDDSLASGGCIVETRESFVNYSVEKRIDNFLHEVQALEEAGSDHLTKLSEESIPDYASEIESKAAQPEIDCELGNSSDADNIAEKHPDEVNPVTEADDLILDDSALDEPMLSEDVPIAQDTASLDIESSSESQKDDQN